MLLPRKWALGLGLLAATPGLTSAGPLDFLRANSSTQESAAQSPERNNQEVAEEIAKALGKARLTHKDVTIEYKAGTAKIGGQIKDASQKALVTRVVSQVPGVQTVENDLRLMDSTVDSQSAVQQAVAALPQQGGSGVQPANGSQFPQGAVTPTSFSAPSNQEVAQNIAEALASSGLSGYDIEVRFKSGIVSLIGNVEDKEQVARAQRAAESVSGVSQVLNKLTVKGQPVAIQQTAGYGPQGHPGYAPQGAPGYGPQGHPGYAPQGAPSYGPQGGPQGGPQYRPQAGPQYAPGMAPPQGYPIQQVQGGMPPGAYAPGMGPQGGPAPVMAPQQYGHAQPVSHQIYNQPYLPQSAWPSYAPYDNYAAVTYPSQYDASAWPYIGPYYPYPQVPLGWRKSTLEWDDGYWSLKFDSKTDRWWWFLNPKNWD